MTAGARFREALRSREGSGNSVVRLGVRSARAAHRLVLLCSTAEHRSTLRARLCSPRALHQTTVLTWMDRYPGIFAACRDHLGDRPGLRILSFGCSTGEEVLTLRRYFPSATIVGAEINTRSLERCRRLAVDDRIAFVASDPETVRRHGPYDAVFCMAVLQRTPHAVEARGTTDLRRLYPFEKFDRQISELDAALKGGGLLVIHHSQYLLTDASAGGHYVALDAPGQEVDFTPSFDRASRRMDRPPTIGSVFVKMRG